MRKLNKAQRSSPTPFPRAQTQQIARSCLVAQSTVHQYLKAAAAAGVSWPLPSDWDERRLEEVGALPVCDRHLFRAGCGVYSGDSRPSHDCSAWVSHRPRDSSANLRENCASGHKSHKCDRQFSVHEARVRKSWPSWKAGGRSISPAPCRSVLPNRKELRRVALRSHRR